MRAEHEARSRLSANESLPVAIPPETGVTFTPPPPRTGGLLGTLLLGLTFVVQTAIWAVAWAGAWTSSVPVVLVLVLTVLPQVALGLLVWNFCLWIVFPDHRLAPWVFGLAALGPTVQWGASWPDRGAPPADDDLVVMTWNVQRLWGKTGGDQRPGPCVIEAIAAADPDIVALQEVTQKDLDALEAKLPLDCVFTTYRLANDATDAGVAVCSHGTDWRLIRGAPGQYDDHEDWQYLLGVFDRGDTRLNVLSVHLHPYRILHDPTNLLEKAAERVPTVAAAQDEQTAFLLGEVARLEEPTIIAGDFNSTRDTPFHARLRRTLVDALERGSQGFGTTVDVLDWLGLRIDYVYTPPSMEVVDAEIPQATCSDHRPIVTRMHPPTSPAAPDR